MDDGKTIKMGYLTLLAIVVMFLLFGFILGATVKEEEITDDFTEDVVKIEERHAGMLQNMIQNFGEMQNDTIQFFEDISKFIHGNAVYYFDFDEECYTYIRLEQYCFKTDTVYFSDTNYTKYDNNTYYFYLPTVDTYIHRGLNEASRWMIYERDLWLIYKEYGL